MVSWNFFAVQDGFHRYNARIGIRNLNTDSAFARYRSNDADTSADKLNAISSSKFLIFEIRTPSAGVISYNVMVGPTLALIELISIPKLRKTLMMRSLLAFALPCQYWDHHLRIHLANPN